MKVVIGQWSQGRRLACGTVYAVFVQNLLYETIERLGETQAATIDESEAACCVAASAYEIV